jgi:hypothetical protein
MSIFDQQLWEDIKHGDRQAEIGSPAHGFTAGYTGLKVLSPTAMLHDSLQGLRDDGISGFFKAGPHDLQDAFKENLPAIGSALGYEAGGWGGLAKLFAGAGSAASVNNQSSSSASGYPPPPTTQTPPAVFHDTFLDKQKAKRQGQQRQNWIQLLTSRSL